MELFDNDSSGAEFSPDRKYRYALWRIWDKKKPLVMYVGLNPSRANEHKPDNTITKVKKIAEHNDFGGFYMTNLFAFVTPYPEELLTCTDPLADNNRWLRQTMIKCDCVVFCWGNFKQGRARAEQVEKMFINPHCLVKNKNGSPKHPLYCLDKTKIIAF